MWETLGRLPFSLNPPILNQEKVLQAKIGWVPDYDRHRGPPGRHPAVLRHHDEVCRGAVEVAKVADHDVALGGDPEDPGVGTAQVQRDPVVLVTVVNAHRTYLGGERIEQTIKQENIERLDDDAIELEKDGRQ